MAIMFANPVRLRANNYAYVDSLYALAKVAYKQGDFVKVKSLSLKIIDYQPNRSNSTAKAYNLLGILNYLDGNNKIAIDFYEKAIHSTNDNNLILSFEMNMAVVYQKTGDSDKAITYYKKILTVIENDTSELKAQVLSNLGIAYYETNRYDKAIQNINSSIKLSEYLNLADFNGALHICAIAYQKKGDLVTAKAYFQKVMTRYKQHYGMINAETANCMTNYAKLLLENGEEHKTFILAKQSYEILMKTVGAKHPYTSDVLETLGDFYYKQKNYREATANYHSALIARITDFNNESVFSVPNIKFADILLLKLLKKKALSLEKMSDSPENRIAALNTVLALTDYIDFLRLTYLTEKSKLYLASNENEVYNQGIHLAESLYKLSGDRNYIEIAYNLSEKAKYAVLRELQNDEHARLHAAIPTEISEREDSIKQRISEILTFNQRVSSSMENPDSMRMKQHHDELFQLTRKHEELVSELELDYPDYYKKKYAPISFSSKDVKKYLANNQALLQYSICDNNLYMFVISKDSLYMINTKIDTTFYKNLAIYKFILHASYGTEYIDFENSSRYLFKSLIAPIDQYLIDKNIEELIIVPDAILSDISFDALLYEDYQVDKWHAYKNEPYLLRKYAISYAFSSSLLVNAKNNNYPIWRNLIAFAPDYSNSPDSLSNIPSAFASVRKFARMLFGKSYTKTKATETNFKYSKGYNIMHFYAHGFEDSINPSLSKMYFYFDTSSTEDSYLYANELSDMKINTNLASLISCYSGSGNISKGEGVMSMGRSFTIAGASSMISSLWSVGMFPSGEIMKDFYKNLKAGKGKSKSLQLAKLAYLKNAEPFDASPRHWAGIVLIGNVEPIFNNFFLKAFGIPLSALFLMLLLCYRKRLFNFFKKF